MSAAVIMATGLYSSSSKFTRGEKCIFAHVVVTFAAILVIVVVYYAHACTDPRQLTSLSRPSSNTDEQETRRCAGMLEVAPPGRKSRCACGSAMLRARWSLAPARCVAARAHPRLSSLLPYWTLRYQDFHTGVRRGSVHPRSEAGSSGEADFGLLEHQEPLPQPELNYSPLCPVYGEPLTEPWPALTVVSWRPEVGPVQTPVQALSAERCARLTAPVASDNTSMCITLLPSNMANPTLGAALFAGPRLVGLASWGGDEHLPLVFAQTAPFNFWLETNMKLLPD